MNENKGGAALKLLLFIIIAAVITALCYLAANFLLPDDYDTERPQLPQIDEYTPPSMTTAEELAALLANFEPSFTVRTDDIEALLAQAYELRPELVMHYNGMSYRSVGKNITVDMQYRMTDATDIAVVYSEAEFLTRIMRAMNNAEGVLYVVYIGESEDAVSEDNLPSISQLIDEVHNLDYVAYMGYTGGETSYTVNDFTKSVAYMISLQYFAEAEQLRSYKEQTRAAVASLTQQLFYEGQSDIERVSAVHDAVIESTRYASDTDDFLYHTAYSAAVLGSAVCQGYAELASLLLDAGGIENYYVEGESKGVGHAWNIVRIGESYYHIDLTWDDPVMSDGSEVIRYNYFNLSDEQMAQDHSWDTSKYPSCDTPYED